MANLKNCCCCESKKTNLKDGQPMPIIYMVPKVDPKATQQKASAKPAASPPRSSSEGFKFLDNEELKKHFDLPPRALYLDPFHRPLITFPMTQDTGKFFNMYKKTKINQQILDGTLDPSEAIKAPSIFPYSGISTGSKKKKEEDEEEEIIYIFRLPDLETVCPIHNTVIKTPRFIWHSSKSSKKEKDKSAGMKKGGGPLNKPKPWLLSRHTDFDYYSQW